MLPEQFQNQKDLQKYTESLLEDTAAVQDRLNNLEASEGASPLSGDVASRVLRPGDAQGYTNGAGMTNAADRVQYLPLFVDTGFSFDRWEIQIVAGNAAGRYVAMALYDWDGNLLTASSTIEAAALQKYTLTFTQYTVTPGRYLIAYVSNNSNIDTVGWARTGYVRDHLNDCFGADMPCFWGANAAVLAAGVYTFPATAGARTSNDGSANTICPVVVSRDGAT
jgi:hypothetical protein